MLHQYPTTLFSLNDAKDHLLGLKSGFLHNKVASWLQQRPKLAQKSPKTIPKISRSALSGDPTRDTPVNNHSIFIE